MDPLELFFAQAEPKKTSNRYIIGAFEIGITVYKQQVRALNLLYSLYEKKRLPNAATIAIIGGGISGITAAAAAIALGYKPYIFEKRPILLHLQHGCDTRWIHPHLYDWPAYGAERPYAGLPLLNWREGTASEVAEQLLIGFKELVKNLNGSHKYIHTGTSVSIKGPLRVKWENSSGDPQNGEKDFDAIIFAVGFGLERDVENGITPSYWRNDDLNQPDPAAPADFKERFLISGTGDSGLIDLLRVCIEGFNQGRILKELVRPDEKTLLSELRRIDKEWEDEARDDTSTWLFDQYSSLDELGLLDLLGDRLKTRLRQDTEAILNGKVVSFPSAIRLDRASMFNTLLAHKLHALGAFKYIGGECNVVSASEVKINEELFKIERVILRHGPDRIATLKSAGFDEGIRALESQDSLRRRLDTSERLWPAGWWGENAKTVLSGGRMEFVPPATETISTTFVSTLSDIIQLHHKDSANLEFRTTLHRLIKVHDEELFQQISRYAGTRTKGMVGRVFNVKGGLVGLASRLGRPVIVKRDENFDTIWHGLHLKDVEARDIDPRVNSLLACPFFAPKLDNTSPTHVALVLFMDSAKLDFFDNHVLEIVYAACKGFVKNLEAMKQHGEVLFSSSDYHGHKFLNPEDDEKFVDTYESVETDNQVFQNFIEDLTFRTITSFESDLTFKIYDEHNES